MSSATPPNPPAPPPTSPGSKLWRVLIPVCAVVLLAVLAVLPFAFGEEVPERDPVHLKSVKVLNANGTRSVSWEAKEAVKFSLDQVVATINYLFLAAAAGLALVGKLILESPAETATPPPLPRGVLVLLVLAGLLWVDSLVCGMLPTCTSPASAPRRHFRFTALRASSC